MNTTQHFIITKMLWRCVGFCIKSVAFKPGSTWVWKCGLERFLLMMQSMKQGFGMSCNLDNWRLLWFHIDEMRTENAEYAQQHLWNETPVEGSSSGLSKETSFCWYINTISLPTVAVRSVCIQYFINFTFPISRLNVLKISVLTYKLLHTFYNFKLNFVFNDKVKIADYFVFFYFLFFVSWHAILRVIYRFWLNWNVGLFLCFWYNLWRKINLNGCNIDQNWL